MQTNEQFISDLTNESEGTKNILLRIPVTNLTWKPHAKSMPIGRLGMHIAELPGWISTCLETREFDFAAQEYKPFMPTAHAQIMEAFDKNLRKSFAILSVATDEVLAQKWKLRFGERLIYDLPRAAVIRRNINHIVHHRGQLSVFLRLLDIPVPGLYGPTADEK
jgi:uncharacterized damage-inducible protein DinB